MKNYTAYGEQTAQRLSRQHSNQVLERIIDSKVRVAYAPLCDEVTSRC